MEGIVDLFFAVHSLRQQQPGIVSTFVSCTVSSSSLVTHSKVSHHIVDSGFKAQRTVKRLLENKRISIVGFYYLFLSSVLIKRKELMKHFLLVGKRRLLCTKNSSLAYEW